MNEGSEDSDGSEYWEEPEEENPPDTPLMHELRDRLAKLWDDSLSVTDETPEGALFHYTTATGFLGIVRDQTIRATDAAFTNDSLELSYGTDLVREVMRGRSFRVDLENDGPGAVFVACFSEEDDDLGQWRAYANDGLGYSIGFELKPDCFVAPDGFENPRLVRVVYSREKQEEQILRVASALEGVAQWLSAQPQTDEEKAGGEWFLRFAARVAFSERVGTFKHHSFRHEREWRFVARPIGPSVKPMYQACRFGLSSYITLGAKPVEVRFGPDATPRSVKGFLPITKVTTGPRIPTSIGERVAAQLLKTSGYLFHMPIVTHSESSYR